MAYDEKVYYELTHPQKRIWYIDKINSNSSLHNIGGCLSISGKIDIETLNRAVNIVIKNNDGLRFRFTEIDDQPMQYLYDYKEEDIQFLDFSKYKSPEKEYQEWSEKEFSNKFNLMDSCLYYFAIYRISKEAYGIFLKIHHIISDGWSIFLLDRQICELYYKLTSGKELNDNKYYSYIDYIREEKKYLQSKKIHRNKMFWMNKFNNLSENFLYNTSNNVVGKRFSFDINHDLSNQIKDFINAQQCSLNTLFITILLIYTYKTTNKNDITIGTAVFNRTNTAQKNMIGMFTSTMPFRFTIDPQMDAIELINKVHKELISFFLNQKYPYDVLVQDLELNKKGYDSLFKVCVNYYNTKFLENIGTIEAKALEYYNGNQSYPLQITIKEWEENKIMLNFDYKTLDYTENEVRAMQKSLIIIIEQIIASCSAISHIKLLSKEEIDYKVYGLNTTNLTYPQKTINKLFEEQAQKTPNKTAIIFGKDKVTYKELNEKTNQLANYLNHRGIGKKSIISILETHSLELMISILGVLKSGAAYLPIDPNYPTDRINYLLKDSSSTLLLINNELYQNRFDFNGELINIKNLDLSQFSVENLDNSGDINAAAYIIYTSGSTGRPKGVVINHKSLTNYIYWAINTYFENENEAMALYSSIAFDLTITSIFAPLISGNKVVIYDSDDGEFSLYKILKEDTVTVIKLTPSHLTLLKNIDGKNSSIKKFIVGGENLSLNLAKEISRAFPHIEIYNEYGPTETTVGCMIHKYDAEQDTGLSVPIGHPIANSQVYLLDQDFCVVPTGHLAQIFISGDGVAQEYLNNEALTKEKFIKNPYLDGKKMYKTGDTGRYLENGTIEYMGRLDNQIKIRGHRIELGEIEEGILEIDGVQEAAIVLKTDMYGNKILNAYIVRIKSIEKSAKEIKYILSKYFPSYMIPSNFIFMDRLPLTPNGKIDVSLLPEPMIDLKDFVDAKTVAEKELIRITKEVLDVENISMNDNFYQLGGDSIKAIQISSKLNNLGYSIKSRDILSYEVFSEIAFNIEESNCELIEQKKESGYFYPTPIIKWFFEQDFSNRNYYNQSVLIKGKRFNIDNVKKSLQMLVEHHDSLRINFNSTDGVFYYNNNHLEAAVDYFDLSGYTKEEQEFKIHEISLEIKSKFIIEKDIMLRTCIFRLSEQEELILFTAHHLIVDGVSWRIILEDFFYILNQLETENKDVKLPLKTHSFMKWSEYLNNYNINDFNGEAEYWNAIVSKNNSIPADIIDYPHKVCKLNTLNISLGKETTKKISSEMYKIYGLELHETLLIALALVISDICKAESVVIEVEGHGREDLIEDLNIARTVGWFTIIYPVMLKVADSSMDFNIKSLKEQLKTIPNKGFGYGILRYLKNKINTSNGPYIRFNYLGDFDNIFSGNDFQFANINPDTDIDDKNHLTSALDITAMLLNEELTISLTYSGEMFFYETMINLLSLYQDIINEMINLIDIESYKKFTPSDFSVSDISQEDIDDLFF